MAVIVRLFLGVCVALTAACPAFAGQCPIKGPRIQWQADYCMFKVGSDDIIAADPCMRADDKRHYHNDCEAKKHYKREMCRMARRNHGIEQTEAQCMKDPSFLGPTVSNNGVGG
jgi:hypothetical protein